jgi:hypothetical protein
MSRNANLDKAKRQAVGIYRAASLNASINHGNVEYSGGDYRVPEGAKACYHDKALPSDADLIAAFQGTIKTCPAFLNSSGRRVVPNDLNRKRSGADPQNRGELVPGRAHRGLPIQQSNPSIFPYTIEVARLLRK